MRVSNSKLEFRQVVADISVATEDLYCAVRDLKRDSRRLVVRQPSEPGRILASIERAGRLPDEKPSAVDLDRHVGELEGDRLTCCDRLAEGLALFCVLSGDLVGGPRGPDASCSESDPPAIDHAPNVSVIGAESGALGNAHTRERELHRRQPTESHHQFRFGRQTCNISRHDEGREPSGFCGFGRGDHHHMSPLIEPGHLAFDAVEQDFVAVLFCDRVGVIDVEIEAGLDDRERTGDESSVHQSGK